MSAEFEKIVLEKFDELNQKIDANAKSINSLSNELHEVKEKVDSNTALISNVSKTLSEKIDINTDLIAILSKKVEQQGLNLASFEDEFTTKVQALFDSFVSNTQSHLSYEKSISVLLAKTSKHDNRISILEDYFKGTKLLATN